ncbi:hypothetical protein SCB71_15470 [Herbiconiux sp. KACC 21604]|uniref:hypothetical protein n=1 Tax=unclassified Herbiconiux TaxID=2618217 RepID=UPI001491A55E|nr:hypothetical protein [Herbiconiux sp. SALV-R1]QJU54526.1 hypothetical protein HL652_13415 [Herbiconiux sp. SALV-R1]WPO85609.1 hypothetical protein SCB71_15470 [Herbiconiux sp. KACC 21604]
MGILLTTGVGAAVLLSQNPRLADEAASVPTSSPIAKPTPTPTSTPLKEDEGTRENPFPLGTPLTFTLSGRENWDVTVNSAILNANDAIAAENPYNEVPPEGMQWALVSIDATYKGVDAGDPGNAIRISYVSTDGRTYDEFDVSAVTPNGLYGQNEIYAGTSTSGNIAVMIPNAEADKGVWALSVDFGPKVFFRAQ